MMIVKEVYLFWHESNKQTNKQTEKTSLFFSFISVEERRYTEFSFTIWMKKTHRMKDGFERKLRIFVCVCGIKWKPNKYHFWDLIT